jgi:hypothetical protein
MVVLQTRCSQALWKDQCRSKADFVQRQSQFLRTGVLRTLASTFFICHAKPFDLMPVIWGFHLFCRSSHKESCEVRLQLIALRCEKLSTTQVSIMTAASQPRVKLIFFSVIWNGDKCHRTVGKVHQYAFHSHQTV